MEWGSFSRKTGGCWDPNVVEVESYWPVCDWYPWIIASWCSWTYWFCGRLGNRGLEKAGTRSIVYGLL